MSHIIIVGTSHISETSVSTIKKVFLDTDPDIVAVELDKQRLHGLLSDAKMSFSPRLIRQIGLRGYLFALIGSIVQKHLGKIVNVNPGADMKQAALLAMNNNKKLLLLDQDITITLRKLSAIPFKERARMAWDVLFGWASKQKIVINLKEVPDQALIDHLLEQLKARYPVLHAILIDQRNSYMAKRLLSAAGAQDSTVLAVVGAGHVTGLKKELESLLKQQVSKQV